MLVATASQVVLTIICLVLGCHGQEFTCPGPDFLRNGSTNCTTCRDPGLDISTGCTTCLGNGSLECEGQDCNVGNFIFSALFHSYLNPTGMCSECGPCSNSVCELRLIYCVQPYGSSAPALELVPQPSLGVYNFTFPEGPIIQDRPGVVRWERTNPYTRELNTWTGRIQFYIVVYYFPPGSPARIVVDRFLIDLELDIGVTERNIYHGNSNIPQFDLSFRVQCSENYYGPQCNCSEVEGQFACDNEGNIVCGNNNRDPQTNCTSCLLGRGRDPVTNCVECLPGRDLAMNCEACLPGKDLGTNCFSCLPWRGFATDCLDCLPGRDLATNCSDCLPGRNPDTGCVNCTSTGRDPSTNCVECLPGSDPSTNCTTQLPGSSNALVGGVIGGSICGILMIFLISIGIITILLSKRIIGNKGDSVVMTQNQVYGMSKEDEKKSSNTIDKMELTQNQVYGVSTADVVNTEEIELTQNQVYGVSQRNVTSEAEIQYEEPEYEIV